MLEPTERNMFISACSNKGNGLGIVIDIEFPQGMPIVSDYDKPFGIRLNIGHETGIALVNQILATIDSNNHI